MQDLLWMQPIVHSTQNQKNGSKKHHKLESRSAMLKSNSDQFQQLTKDMIVRETEEKHLA